MHPGFCSLQTLQMLFQRGAAAALTRPVTLLPTLMHTWEAEEGAAVGGSSCLVGEGHCCCC